MQDHIFNVLGILNWQSKIAPKKDIMLIYDAPVLDETADNLLTAMLKAIDLHRNQVEVIVHTPNLSEQITSLQPILIMTAGEKTAQDLLQTKSPLESLRNQLHGYGDNQTTLVATYHPVYLIQNPADKRQAYQDLLLIQRTLRDKRNGRLPLTPEQTLSSHSS